MKPDAVRKEAVGPAGSLRSPAGVLLVDKPAGMSSHDVVYRVRRATGLKKVGHGGTLDPFATGLLLVLIGRATRLFDYLAPLRKDYRVTAQFGGVSSTGDTDGEITPAGTVAPVSESGLRRVLPEFTGTIKQRIPAYSAVKVGGVPLYKRTRAGQQIAPMEREVTIDRLELLSFDSGRQQAVLDVICSKGTYIRQLCADLGERLGSGAYAAALRRQAIGELRVEDALSLEELESIPGARVLQPENPSFISGLGALYFLPVRELGDSEVRDVTCGRQIEGYETGPVRLAHAGGFIAIYGPADTHGFIKPLLVLT